MIRRLLALLALAPLACGGYETCDEADASFVLPAPGDAVELIVHACVPTHRNGLEILFTLTTDHPSAETLAIKVDGVGLLSNDEDMWMGVAIEDIIYHLDCDPGRRITIRRLDSDDTVTVSGSISVEIYAPKRKTCSADIDVTPPA